MACTRDVELRERRAHRRFQSLGRPGEAQPLAGRRARATAGLDLAAARPRAEQARRDHLGVVEDQQIARLQQLGQVAHAAVVQAVRRHVEQACAVARYGRTLGDQLFGQVEVEEIDAHSYAAPVSITSVSESSAGGWASGSTRATKRCTPSTTLRFTRARVSRQCRCAKRLAEGEHHLVVVEMAREEHRHHVPAGRALGTVAGDRRRHVVQSRIVMGDQLIEPRVQADEREAVARQHQRVGRQAAEAREAVEEPGQRIGGRLVRPHADIGADLGQHLVARDQHVELGAPQRGVLGRVAAADDHVPAMAAQA